MEVALGPPTQSYGRRKVKTNSKDEDTDFSKPATSAYEYLRRVQKEASLCPEVVVAKDLPQGVRQHESNKNLVKTVLTPARNCFIPSKDWQLYQASEFAELRQGINYFKRKDNSNRSFSLPSIHNEDQWCIFCLGEEKWKEIRKQRNMKSKKESRSDGPEETFAKLVEGNQPLLSIVTSLKQGRWIFALFACLEKPLPPNVSSLLRTLARRCADLRACLVDENDDRLAPLNLIITLVTRFVKSVRFFWSIVPAIFECILGRQTWWKKVELRYFCFSDEMPNSEPVACNATSNSSLEKAKSRHHPGNKRLKLTNQRLFL
eukprot:gene6045-6747_t